MRYVLAVLPFLLLPRFLAHDLHGAGLGGGYYFLFLGLAALVHGAVIRCRARENDTPLGVVADMLHQSAILLTFLALSTLALGVAGFTFNEVFWYTFPNLGFSFALLVLAGLLCLLGRDHFLLLVSSTAGFSLAGILGVSLAAIPTMLSLPHAAHSPDLLAMAMAAAPVLLGADLVYGVGNGEKRALGPAVGATVAGAAVLGVLAWAGLLTLDGSRLASLSVPQMALGREVLGNNGRMIMGGAGILCTLGGVAVMLRSAMRMDSGNNRRELRAVLGCAMVAAMLGLGLSGEELTETLLLAALAVWFLANALTCGSCIGSANLKPGKRIGLAWAVFGLLGSLALGAAWVWGGWEHILYAPQYLREFFDAHAGSAFLMH